MEKKQRMLSRVSLLLILVGLAVAPWPATADITLPKLISDGMVLQRDTELDIWGRARPGERVTLRFGGKTYRTTTESDGEWQFRLPPLPAGGPHTMHLQGDNRITIADILLGDVWLCSGQSNMVHTLNIHDVEYADDIAQANYPHIRQFLVPNATDLATTQADLPSGRWERAVGEDVRRFSVVAYFFAKQLHEQHQVPIGLINASVGGTPIEAWTSEGGLEEFPDIMDVIRQNKDTAYINARNREALESTPLATPNDLGLLSDPKWFETEYRPASEWRTINVPGYWEDQGVRDLDGIVWYRREVDIPASMAGKPARVFLGRIVDADVLYINGHEVGNTGYMYPQRRYHVPDGVLKAGKNTFVVRVTNHAGKGGFVPDKPYCVVAGADTVDIRGTWLYQVGEVFDPARARQAVQGISAQNQPAALFNAMIAPLANYALKGVLWYQGESNTGRPREYAKLLPALISDWRRQWHDDALPFLFVQLPGFMEYNYLPSESNWAQLRESQRTALSIPRTGMAVAIDLGEWNDIHPARKGEVGTRLVRLARHIAYGEDIVPSGPIYADCRKEGNQIIVAFNHVGNGLVANDGQELAEFAIAGEDRVFVWARAKIVGDHVVVWHENIPDPVYVRYGWADNPVNPNLYNREGLPASPFQAGVLAPR